ncbi:MULTISPECIES: L-aspartate oxidase [unclassified Mesorhizobium]|uniref:L-aspartate oxidase n=2 Tax=Mesorhizobium TaxID=68287 RepID=UPI000FE7BF3D|nr:MULTISPECIES: L-aspartate oxidase [unclassified Mesorhizobium]MCP9234160.1 L-aspartate oxidase [Mesorhizobium sp. LMG 17147]RWK74315.1 MAG: L-aspartate oxidase [Mesorhizobium sp.]RWK85069.1 MAG: L-aspartate oxidase [Mesorhizobium sp.]RWL04808.1 MAG: L-aspartate oxidase [Mesorhizobium sp.]RWL10559.1 MAG: L-aspartate oxidase [Mesorhizobium sp.]
MSLEVRDIAGAPVVIGGGIAGLMTALHLAPEPVVLLTNAPLGTGACSELAQGGLAASLGGDDGPDFHLCDTIAAGDGLCDEATVRRVVRAAPEAIRTIQRFGVAFDQHPDRALRLGLEAAHSRRRIVHAAGDATGRELVRVLIASVRRTASITTIENVEVRRLIVQDGSVIAVVAAGRAGALALPTRRAVLATGGVGGLFCDTTNPAGSWGHGLALAAWAGAELADLEFIQFHPTALDGPRRPMPLVSEAVRGEGAVLIDERGERFLADTPGGELAPRDVVARAIWHQLAVGRRVFLDARQSLGPRFGKRFPGIAELCRSAGVDPATDPIPVRPAAHYHMGGVAVDSAGRSSIEGLWACGEVACTGLHGANRLASNSLTEAAVTASWVAESVAGTSYTRRPRRCSTFVPPRPDASAVRPIVSAALGIIRDGEAMREAVATLLPIAADNVAASGPALVSLMIAVAALGREESRGAHCRSDFPLHDADARPSRLTLHSAMRAAAALDCRATIRST